MANKINRTDIYPNTTPANGDYVLGVDVSNTTNDENGEVVTFRVNDILATSHNHALSDVVDYGLKNPQDVTTLLADTSLTYTEGRDGTVVAGDIVRTRAEGFSYEVAASGATDQHVTTAGGVKLYVLPGQSGYNVKAFGALGDGVTDDTAAIQTAFDADLGTLLFPEGIYKVSCGALDTECLLLANNTNIIGLSGQQQTRIVGYMSGNTTGAVIRVEFAGSGDVRNWTFQGIAVFPQDGGKDGLYISDSGLPILTSRIVDCLFGRNPSASGNALYVGFVFAHGLIQGNTFSGPVRCDCGDANLFSKNLSFGGATEFAFTFDLVFGVRNNTVKDNTLVSQGGALRVINGQEIRFINNQCEQAGGLNGNPVESMVWLEGADREVENTVISENNFGGGTNYKRSIYIDNANGTKIQGGNRFIAPGQDSIGGNCDVFVTSNAKNTIIFPDNFVQETIFSVRKNSLTPLSVIDTGVSTTGSIRSIVFSSGWSGSRIFKDVTGKIGFTSAFSGGTTTAGDVIAQLPEGFYPADQFSATRRNLFDSTADLTSAAWVVAGIDVSENNGTAPNGRNEYNLISATATTGVHFFRNAGVTLASTSQHAVSFYVQRTNGSTTSQIRGLFDGPTGNATFTVNLTTGAVIATGLGGAAVSGSSTAVGSGWRVVLLYTPAATGTHYLRFTPKNESSVYNSYTGNPSVDNFLIWGPQVEVGSAATDYQIVYSSTVFAEGIFDITLPVITSGGAGSVVISSSGQMSVGSLPASDFSAPAFQGNVHIFTG